MAAEEARGQGSFFRSLTFMTWTVDDEKDMDAMCVAGVDSICSNFPDLVKRVVDAAGRR